eukprot:2090880-Pyramimonas_sp.AAC.1
MLVGNYERLSQFSTTPSPGTVTLSRHNKPVHVQSCTKTSSGRLHGYRLPSEQAAANGQALRCAVGRANERLICADAATEEENLMRSDERRAIGYGAHAARARMRAAI